MGQFYAVWLESYPEEGVSIVFASSKSVAILKSFVEFEDFLEKNSDLSQIEFIAEECDDEYIDTSF